MASNDFNARRWTHADALMLASVRDVKALASLMDLSVLGSRSAGSQIGSGSAQAGCGNLPVSQVVRRLAPVGFAAQGTSAPIVGQVFGHVSVETEVVELLPTAAERQGTAVPTAAPRNYKSISVDPRPVTGKGRKSGVPPRGRPEEKG